MPYPADEFRAQHLDGCTLDPDHAGACLLARPFRIRPEGGREYLDHDEAPRPTTPGPDTRQRAEDFVRACLGEYAADFDVPAIADELHEHAGHSWDMSRVPEDRFWQAVRAHDVAPPHRQTPQRAHDLARANLHDEDGQDETLPELTARSSVAEVGWIAREARALREVDDPERRARFLERKRRLLDFIETTTNQSGDQS